LFEHFRAQYLAAGLIILSATAVSRRLAYFDAALVATMLNALVVAPDLGRRARPVPELGSRVRVLLLNVHTESNTFDDVRRLIDDEKPDLIGLVEVDERWLDALAPSLTDYVGRIEAPRADNFGVALYSRGRVTGSAEKLDGALPSVVAGVDVPMAELAVILTHPLPPTSGAAFVMQRGQLDAVATRARSFDGSVIVMGDFNATPWSRPFARLVHESGLCDSRAGFCGFRSITCWCRAGSAYSIDG
jgi:endonuclease/exonuclease/phosphatase (EEP) superfamily protein YafD